MPRGVYVRKNNKKSKEVQVIQQQPMTDTRDYSRDLIELKTMVEEDRRLLRDRLSTIILLLTRLQDSI
jgi:hypothetical protein